MDFFAAEKRARTRTAKLLVLFGLAVAGTVASGYVGTVVIQRAIHLNAERRSRYYDSGADTEPLQFWQPGLFAAVAAGTLAVIGLASLYKWSEFSAGGSAVAEGVGGRKVDPHTTDPKEHQLLNVVEEMAIASGLPVPGVYVMDDEAGINAFAAGLTPNDAVVTVTRGTLDKLTRDELQGVVAHEFSHILNGDMRLNVRVSAVLFGILVLGLAGRATLMSMRYSRIGGSRDEKGNGGVILVLAVGVGLLVVGYVGYFFGRLIQASVSRQREFLADASAVQFTRNPPGVTGALKKIGGYAIGSSLDTHKAAEIGHFFFAQGYVPAFGGLWATHPPLEERIRAIDPGFDGKFPEPPEMVDVSKEPWSRVPHMPPARPAPSPAANAAFGAALAAAAGTVAAGGPPDARSMIAEIPAAVRTAARSPHDAPILLYGLLLDGDETVRRKQLASIASSDGADALHTLEKLDPLLRQVRDDQKLSLVQLALPALKAIPPTALGTFAGTLDDLVQADGRVTPFEYALQRLVLRALRVNRAPSASVTQVFSFQAVAAEISVVLSALARLPGADEDASVRAFAEGAAQLKLVEASLALVAAADCDLEKLDAALNRLDSASLPIKQRLIVAAAHVVGADGVVTTEESELVRAIAASLDVPVPPLSEVTGA
jgi:Zn-dependent protease with chaperone function